MEWIKLILPFVGVLLGWALSESSKIYSDKKQDKRKLKKLLFCLLELRNHFAREFSLEIELKVMVEKFTEAIEKTVGEKIDFSPYDIKPLLEYLKEKLKSDDSNIDLLEASIDKVIDELSEVLPIFAYELSGQHRIKERLKKANNYFDEIETIIAELPFDLKRWVQPKLTEELLKNLDENIIKIAEKIDTSTKKQVLEKIEIMEEQDDPALDHFIDNYVTKIKESISLGLG